MYAIQVQIERTVNGWTSSVGIPTFYLDENVQGITSENGAAEIARRIVDPVGAIGGTLHVSAVKL